MTVIRPGRRWRAAREWSPGNMWHRSPGHSAPGGALRTVECQAVSGRRFTAEITADLAGAFEAGRRARLTARRVMVEAVAPGAASPGRAGAGSLNSIAS